MFEQLTHSPAESVRLRPQGFCLLWNPELLWTYAVSDIGIAIAFLSIPLAFAVLVSRRRDPLLPPVRPVLWLFGCFIFLCGTTHLLDVITLWVPLYRTEAIAKMSTAVMSIVTAIALWRILPKILLLPSPRELEAANAALRASEERLHQAHKMEAIGQLTGGIAHDFNNMLQSIIGGLELVERRIAQGRAAEAGRYIAASQKAADTASALTNRMLAFARRQVLRPAVVDLDTLLRGLTELIQSGIGPSVQLEMNLEKGRWLVACDPSQLESAVLNLAINARDAMPEGGTLQIASAELTLTSGDLIDQDDVQPGDYLEISVADTGTGMSPDVLLRAFEPFFTTRPFGQGTGLGLSQVYGFVRQSGGFVRLESKLGHGTTVHLFLPRHDHPDAEATVSSHVTTSATHADAPAREALGAVVLVVEDDKSIRDMIVGILHERGYSVMEADDGPSGLRIVQSSVRLDLLLTDVGLPGLNGRQLADAARLSRPSLPVLLITGYAGTNLDNKEVAPGIQVLRKPFAFDTLSIRVRDMIDSSDRASIH